MHLEVRELLKEKGRSFVLILVLLAVLALVGCGSSKTKVSADEVVQDSLAAQAGVTSSHVEITLDATAQGTLSGSALNVALTGTANGDFDWANKKMKAHVTADITYNAYPVPTVTMDMYAVDNCSYTQTTAFGTTDNWTKAALPMDFWFTPDNAQFINSILQSTQAEYLPNEKVDGINCYVVQLTPDIAAIQQTLSQQSSTDNEVPNLANLVSNLSFKVWVAKDTSFVTKIEIALSAHIPPEVLGETANSGGLDITLTISMQATDFNKSLSIELPAEAQNAKEGSSQSLLNMFGM